MQSNSLQFQGKFSLLYLFSSLETMFYFPQLPLELNFIIDEFLQGQLQREVMEEKRKFFKENYYQFRVNDEKIYV